MSTLELTCDKPLSNVGFKFNLRHYLEDRADFPGAAAGAGAAGAGGARAESGVEGAVGGAATGTELDVDAAAVEEAGLGCHPPPLFAATPALSQTGLHRYDHATTNHSNAVDGAGVS